MGALATDDFNRADGGLGANWTTISGDEAPRVGSNQLIQSAAGVTVGGALYNNATWPNDQYSQLVIKTRSTISDEGCGPAVRMNSANGNEYFVQTNTSETRLYKRVGGGYTQLGSDAAACAVNDVLYVSAVGTTITVKKNGSTIIGPVTDSGIATGSAGIWITPAAACAGDDWEGGDFTSGASTGSANGSGSADGVAKSIVLASASANGAGVANGVAKSTVLAHGDAAGTGAAPGASGASSASTASAAGTGDAPGVPASQARSTSSATGAGAAPGVGKSLATSVGTTTTPAGVSYSTNFPSDENPISEAGNWVNGLATGLDWNNPKTASGHAIASILSGATGTRYDDSIAHVKTTYGVFPADQYAQGIVYRVPGYAPPSSHHEIELLLRFQITAHNARGYEVMWGQEGYLAFVRWNGPIGDYTDLGYAGPDLGPAVDGDVLRAEIIGNTISVYLNGVFFASMTDSTYTDGQPGMGFWPVDSATPDQYGWRHWEAGSTSPGIAIASGIGKSIARSAGSANGAGAAPGVSAGATIADGSASGSGTASGAAASRAVSPGNAAGAGDAPGVGKSTDLSAGNATGSGAAPGVGVSNAKSYGSAAGAGDAAAVGKALATADGSAAGTGTATGFSGSSSVATALGSGTADGSGSSRASSVGSASGSGTASGVGQSIVTATGAASGSGSATGMSGSLIVRVHRWLSRVRRLVFSKSSREQSL